MNSAFGTMGRRSLEPDWLTWKRVGVFQQLFTACFPLSLPSPPLWAHGKTKKKGGEPDERKPYPRPKNGIFVAITVIVCTFASSGNPAM